ncbi:MAG: electron transport complex subunit E [Clostridia bacterium]|nr:electron transport complex subunit E [Clostridia bacterium]
MSKLLNGLKRGIITENPILVLVLGMCPTLATTSSMATAVGMGVAATIVLICSNIFVSLLRKIIPDKVRIAAYIVVIATFVTIVEMALHAFVPSLYDALGLFLPLIVVNCIILGRAEAYASKNNVLDSAIDGLSMGIGFTFSLLIVATIRELLGGGTLFAGSWFGIESEGITVFSKPALMMSLVPGGFLTLGFVLGMAQFLRTRSAKKKEEKEADSQ